MPIYFIIVIAYVVVLIATSQRAAQRRTRLPGTADAEAARGHMQEPQPR